MTSRLIRMFGLLIANLLVGVGGLARLHPLVVERGHGFNVLTVRGDVRNQG